MSSPATPGISEPAVPRRRSRMRSVLRAIGIGVLVLIAFAVILVVAPIDRPTLPSSHAPAADYAAAMAAYDRVVAREATEALNPACRSRLLTTGATAARAIVLMHGYTNCPAQMSRLAEQLLALGYNVYVPLAPRHGGADPRASELADLTSEELMAYGDEAVDIAAGLGDDVTVLGLSGGGTVAGYLGQTRPEVDLAVPVAPFLGLRGVPGWLTPGLINLAGLLPPIGWLTPEGGIADGTIPPYASLDNNTRSARAYMRLGNAVLAWAATTPRAAARSITITNAFDDTVDNPLADELRARWAALAPNGTGYEFGADLRLPHDLIGPDRSDARTDVVYPVLLQLLQAP